MQDHYDPNLPEETTGAGTPPEDTSPAEAPPASASPDDDALLERVFSSLEKGPADTAASNPESSSGALPPEDDTLLEEVLSSLKDEQSEAPPQQTASPSPEEAPPGNLASDPPPQNVPEAAPDNDSPVTPDAPPVLSEQSDAEVLPVLSDDSAEPQPAAGDVPESAGDSSPEDPGEGLPSEMAAASLEPVPEEPFPGQEPLEVEPENDPEAVALAQKRRKRNRIINIIIIACIAVLAIAIIQLLLMYSKYKTASDEYEQLKPTQLADGLPYVDLDALRKINPDLVGWVLIPDTRINYPVVQTDDNVYYLLHTFERTENPSGAIFLDCQANTDFSMTNTLLHGHHMKDGSMFAGLAAFVEKEGTLKENPFAYIYTDEGVRVYNLFEAKQITIHDREMAFQFADEEEENAFIEEMGGQQKGLEAGDKLLSLVTCVNSWDSTDNRYIVQGVYKETLPLPEKPATSSVSSASASTS